MPGPGAAGIKRNRIRGIRTSIPSGYTIGRTSPGKGPTELIPLTSLGTALATAGAIPLPTGGGSSLITAVDSNFTVSGGTLELHTIASGDLLGNATGSTAEPTATTLTALIDEAIGSTEGNILYRDASVWKVLAPGTLNYVLTMGTAIPAWAGGGISFTYEGAWSGTAGYSPGNVATYLGSAYCNYVAVSAPGVSNDQWNSSDSFDMTISTTNTTNDTATSQAASNTYVNALSVGQTSGLWYFEAVCSNLLDNGTSLGIGAANWSSGGGAAGIYMVGNALGNVGGSASGAGSGSFAGLTNNKRAGVAVNFTTNKFWITADVTASPINWNGSTSNSPGAGTGGISMGTLTGAMFPTWYGQHSAAQVCTIYATSTGASAVIIPAIPAGFSLWAPSASPNTSPDQDDTHWLSQGNVNTVWAAEGELIQGGTTDWQVLAPGTAGQVLTSGGASALNSWTTLSGYAGAPGGRLSLTSAVAVQTADVVNGTTIYYVPYIHDQLPVVGLTLGSGVSLALAAGSQLSGKIYDLFLFNHSGTLVLGTGTAWTNSTTRSQAIDQTTVPGIWTNTGTITLTYDATPHTVSATAGTALYVGSMYASGNGECTVQFNPSGAAGGSNTIVGFYNIYNQVPFMATSRDSNASWSYSGAWRAADNSTSNRISFLDGLGTTHSTAFYIVNTGGGGTAENAQTGVTFNGVGIPDLIGDVDQTTSALYTGGYWSTTPFAVARPTLGFNFWQAVEQDPSGTSTFFGGGGSGKFFQMLVMQGTY